MQDLGKVRSHFGLENHGITNTGAVYWNLHTAALYEQAIHNREGHLAHLGPLIVRTGQHTGRSANDKFTVTEPSSQNKIWWGKHNKPFSVDAYNILKRRLLSYWQGKQLYVNDVFAGHDPDYQMPVRIVTETAWHSLFVRNMFILATEEQQAKHVPDFTVLHAPNFHASPEEDGTRTDAFVIINFAERTVIIGGTQYAGEIKKSIFTALNYYLPQKNVLSMHCSANMDESGETAIFFGLSGTGKTTLSADASRVLIGDDEHGWSDNGVFNFEGGCYAKVIRLSPEGEPEIFGTTRRFGTILENVGFDIDKTVVNLEDNSLTENTRASYPIGYIPNASKDGQGGHPKNIIMLTADAFGVLPPIAKLTREQALFHFLSGYTAKVAGTERGVTEPQATFSACYGAPFMALSPVVYANLLGQKIDSHEVNVWLINTGWIGGPHGIGERIKLKYTRAMVNGILDGKLDDVETVVDPIFGLHVPTAVEGVPAEVLNPRQTWDDPLDYDRQAVRLAEMFVANFEQFAGEVDEAVLTAGPAILERQ